MLLTLAAIQTVAMVAIVFGLRPFDKPASTTLVVVGAGGSRELGRRWEWA